MEMRTCATCGGHWVNDQFFWATGKEGSELDLAGLVCNQIDQERPCINPSQGCEGGQTWEMRQKMVERIIEEL